MQEDVVFCIWYTIIFSIILYRSWKLYKASHYYYLKNHFIFNPVNNSNVCFTFYIISLSLIYMNYFIFIWIFGCFVQKYFCTLELIKVLAQNLRYDKSSPSVIIVNKFHIMFHIPPTVFLPSIKSQWLMANFMMSLKKVLLMIVQIAIYIHLISLLYRMLSKTVYNVSVFSGVLI